MADSPEPPLILFFRPPSLTFLDDPLSRNFRLLLPHESPDPIPVFLRRSPAAAAVRALITVGLVPVTGEIISLLPSLEIIVCTSVGIDHIDAAECMRRGITVTNAGDAFSEDVADFAVGLLFGVLRRVSAADRFVRSGLWLRNEEFSLGFKLGGKRVGIVGLGSIGSLVAKRLEPFGCIVSYNSRTKKPNVPYRYYPDILSLASNNDVLVLCCSLTNETHHIVNKEVMEMLGRDGVIINVGRGGLIDEKELVSRLVEGKIGGAGLDVFENEPEVPEELFGLDNVMLSPHVAVLTPESLKRVGEIALGNLKAFFTNQPLISPVQLD